MGAALIHSSSRVKTSKSKFLNMKLLGYEQVVGKLNFVLRGVIISRT